MPKYQIRFSTIPGGPDDEAYFIETETIEGVGVGSDHGFDWKWDGYDGTALLVVPDDPALVKALKEAISAIEYIGIYALGQDVHDGHSYRDELLHNLKQALGEHND